MVTDGETSPGQEQVMFRVLFLNQLLEPRFHCDADPLLDEMFHMCSLLNCNLPKPLNEAKLHITLSQCTCIQLVETLVKLSMNNVSDWTGWRSQGSFCVEEKSHDTQNGPFHLSVLRA